MNNFTRCTIVGLLASALLCGAVQSQHATRERITAVPEAENGVRLKAMPTPITNYNWTLIAPFGEGNPYTVDTENEEIVASNPYAFVNFLVTDDFDTRANDYSVRLDWYGVGASNTNEIHIGFVPWYIDAGNFIWCFVKHHPVYAGQGVHQIFIRAIINGATAFKWNGSFVPGAEWTQANNSGDFDGANVAGEQPDPSLGGYIQFSKTTTQVNGTPCDQFSFSVNKEAADVAIFYRDSATTYYAEKPQIGLYSFVTAGTIRYTNLSYTKGAYKALPSGITANSVAFFDQIDTLTCADLNNASGTAGADLIASYEALNAFEKEAVDEARLVKDKYWNVKDLYDYYVTIASQNQLLSIGIIANNDFSDKMVTIGASLVILSIASLFFMFIKKRRLSA